MKTIGGEFAAFGEGMNNDGMIVMGFYV